ncbi:MAG: hypothetical protein MHPSP_004662, partial [Paramarteilia canceri]
YCLIELLKDYKNSFFDTYDLMRRKKISSALFGTSLLIIIINNSYHMDSRSFADNIIKCNLKMMNIPQRMQNPCTKHRLETISKELDLDQLKFIRLPFLATLIYRDTFQSDFSLYGKYSRVGYASMPFLE